MTRSIALPCRKAYRAGAYTAWAEPWGCAGLVEGRDYTSKITVRPDTFPGATQFEWTYPGKPPAAAPLYAWDAIAWGNVGGYPNPAVPVRRVADLTRLVQRHAVGRITGARGQCNVQTDLWLSPTRENGDVKAFEVQVFFRTSDDALRYVLGSEQVGTYTDAEGRAWRVAINRKANPDKTEGRKGFAPAILFMPMDRADVLAGETDLLAMLAWLRARGVITGGEWLHGLAFGVEVVSYAGSLRLDEFAVDAA